MTLLDTDCLGEAVMCSSNWCAFTGRLRCTVLGFLANPEKAAEPVMPVASPSAEKAPEPVMPVPSPSAEKAEPVASPSSSTLGRTCCLDFHIQLRCGSVWRTSPPWRRQLLVDMLSIVKHSAASVQFLLFLLFL